MTDQELLPVKLFFLHSPEDEKLIKRLRKHLSPLEKSGQIIINSIVEIKPGQEQEAFIRLGIEEAHIVLLFLSANFMDSQNCRILGIKIAWEKHQRQAFPLIPIILSPVQWENEPFGTLQPLPTNRKPVTSWSQKEQAWYEIATGIQQSIKDTQFFLEKYCKKPPQSPQASFASSKSEENLSPKSPENPYTTSYTEYETSLNKQPEKVFSIGNDREICSLTVQDVIELWLELLSEAKRYDVLLAVHLSSARVFEVTEIAEKVKISLLVNNHLSYEYLSNPQRRLFIASMLLKKLQRDCHIVLIEASI